MVNSTTLFSGCFWVGESCFRLRIVRLKNRSWLPVATLLETKNQPMFVFFDVFDCGMIFEIIPFQLGRIESPLCFRNYFTFYNHKSRTSKFHTLNSRWYERGVSELRLCGLVSFGSSKWVVEGWNLIYLPIISNCGIHSMLYKLKFLVDLHGICNIDRME